MADDSSAFVASKLEEISKRRNELIEAYISAWIALNVPDENLRPDWLVNNLMLQETRSSDGLTTTWTLVPKK